MNEQNHPVTPPPKLVQQWWAKETYYPHGVALLNLATKAPRWGADQRLEACCEYITGTGRWFADPQRRIAELRAADLLEQRHPAPVPVVVADALIKAECALSDIAEGEPMTDEGDPLQWAERRCADTLAIIRPWMKQYGIRTSEWPPAPHPATSCVEETI